MEITPPLTRGKSGLQSPLTRARGEAASATSNRSATRVRAVWIVGVRRGLIKDLHCPNQVSLRARCRLAGIPGSADSWLQLVAEAAIASQVFEKV